MTKKELERGNELRKEIDHLWATRKDLEEMLELCRNNRDIGKMRTHDFFIEALNGNGNKPCINISPQGAYKAICVDIEDIDLKLEKLGREFESL